MVEIKRDDNSKILDEASWTYRVRHRIYTLRKWAYMDEDEQKADSKRVVHETIFQYKRGIDPGFYRWVKKELKKISWVQTHIDELGYLILLDMLHPKLTTMKSAKKTMKDYGTPGNGLRKERITARHRRRIVREYYPEIFFTPPEGLKMELKDKRESPFKSIFTQLPPTKDFEIEAAYNTLLFEDLGVHAKFGNLEDVGEIHSALRMVEPEDIISLRTFWKGLKVSLEAVLNEFGPPKKDKEWLVLMVKEKKMGLETFYRLVENAVALRWFRNKPEKRREDIIYKGDSLRYSKEDAVRAVAENLNWFKDPAQVFNYISRGADAYAAIGMPKVSIILYLECFKQIPMHKRDIGLCHHNLACTYRQMNKPRKALSEYKNAMDVWRELGSQFDIGITWAYFGEIYNHVGKEDLARNSFEKSFDILMGCDLTPAKQTKAFLYVADCASRIQKEAWERKALELCLEASSKLEDMKIFPYISERLLDLNMGKSTLEAEKEPGKLRHPPEFLWYKPTPSTFVPIHQIRKKDSEKEN